MTVRVTLPAVLDEAFDSSSWPRDLPLILDGSSVRRVSSAGVRRWIEALRQIPRGQVYSVERLSPPMLRQFLTIRNFLDPKRVGSVLAPMACDTCGSESVAELNLDQIRSHTKRCSCGATSVVDLPEEYLACLTSVTGA